MKHRWQKLRPVAAETFGSRWTTVNGVRTYARTWAAAGPSAPPVLLVHGLGVSSRYMIPLADRLAARFRVYAIDLPGFGLSEKPSHALNVRELAAHVLIWMDDVGLPSVGIVANSLGGQVAVELAAAHPERVSRLVLVGPAAGTSQRIAGQVARWLGTIPREPLALTLTTIRDCIDCGLPRVASTLRHASKHPMLDRAAFVKAPTLVVRGERDMIASAKWVHLLAATIPIGTSETIVGAGHAAHFDSVDRFAALVEPFLDRTHGMRASA